MSYVIEMRRKIHTFPEIGFDLPKTLTLIKGELDKFGISYTEKYGKSSIVATINPDKTNYTIGIRADMDALPVLEKTDCSYKSKIKGQMHACGHDAHTAILLDVARRLSEMKDSLTCQVKLIFQAAEEYTVPGAKLLVEDGVLEGVDCMLALHVDPNTQAGSIAVKTGALNALSNGFNLDFYGRSAHVAKQELGVDAISIAVKSYTAIELMLAKELPFDSVCLFNIGKIQGGITSNVICDKVNAFCSLRTHDEKTAEYVIKRIKEIVRYTAKAGKGRAKYTQLKCLPIVYNDDVVTEKLKQSAKKVVGEENIRQYERSTIGEDFAFYAQKKPSCMFFLGVRNEEKKCTYALHQDKFNVDEQALSIGSHIFVQFVLDNMNNK